MGKSSEGWIKSSYCSGADACVEWRKSSFCDTGISCAEVACEHERYLIRNSNDPDVVLSFTKDEWKAFVYGVEAGEFDVG